MDEIKTLAAGVAALGDKAQDSEGSLMVLVCAVLALVRSHPQPEVFSDEFRRSWLLLGSQQSNAAVGEKTQRSIDQMLSMLEESCAVPLSVRPPRAES